MAAIFVELKLQNALWHVEELTFILRLVKNVNGMFMLCSFYGCLISNRLKVLFLFNENFRFLMFQCYFTLLDYIKFSTGKFQSLTLQVSFRLRALL